MNETERKIIRYLREHGLDISMYVDTFRHVVPGTVCIVSISMWGYGGCAYDWAKLRQILSEPDCPITMESVEPDEHERKYAFDRLVWKEAQS